MNKLLLPLFALSFVSVQAQEDAANKFYNKFLSGNVSITVNESDRVLSSFNPEYSGSLALTTGFQASDRLYWGIGPTFRYAKDNGFQYLISPVPQPLEEFTLNELSFGATAFVRHILASYSKLDLFVAEQIGFSRTQTKLESANVQDETKTSNLSLGVNMGLQYQLIDRLRLTTSFGGLNFSTQKFDNQEWNNRFNASIFSQFSFGGEWLF